MKGSKKLTKQEFNEKYIKPFRRKCLAKHIGIGQFMLKSKTGSAMFKAGVLNYLFNNKIDGEWEHNTLFLSKKLNEIIKEGHSINASTTGIFMDYLTRITVAIIKKIEFKDDRFYRFINLEGEKKIKDKIYYKKNIININYAFKNTWKVNHQFKESRFDLMKIIESISTKEKMKNHIKDLFMYSLVHQEWFIGMAQIDWKVISDFFKTGFLDRISETYFEFYKGWEKYLKTHKQKVLLNPLFDGLDADLMIGKTMYEIKCTKAKTNFREFNQLLFYCALALHSESFCKSGHSGQWGKTLNKKMDMICVIDYYNNTISYSDVSKVTNSAWLRLYDIM